MLDRLAAGLLAVVVLGLDAGVVRGAEPGGCPEDGHRRAGWPLLVRRCAKPSDTGRYVGYCVGGGAPVRGEAPWPCDGTWGWDYRGFFLPKKVALGWYHGRRSQGGVGAYRTDGRNLDNPSSP